MTQVPPSIPPAPEPSQRPVVPVCYRHPKRETYLRCSRCDRPICPECMTEASVGHHCPECVAEGRRSVRQGKTTFGGSPVGAQGYVTKALVAINVAMLVLGVAVTGGQGLFGGGLGGILGGSTELTEWGAVVGQIPYQVNGGGIIGVPGGIADGEWYRLFTSLFIHYGLVHLGLNMWALWVLGRNLEGALGPVRFTVLYLVSGLGGSVACYVFNPMSQSAGASGAIYGLFAALFILLRRLRRDTSAIISVLVINLVFSFAIPGISIAAHLGGLITGGILAVGLAYAPKNIRNQVLIGTVAVLLLFMGGAILLQTIAINAQPIPAFLQ